MINRWRDNFLAVGRLDEEDNSQTISVRTSIGYQEAFQPTRKILVEYPTYAIQQHRRPPCQLAIHDGHPSSMRLCMDVGGNYRMAWPVRTTLSAPQLVSPNRPATSVHRRAAGHASRWRSPLFVTTKHLGSRHPKYTQRFSPTERTMQA